MNAPPLAHIVYGAFLSWFLACFAWIPEHPGQVASLLASAASLLTGWAALRAGIYWRNKERDRRAGKGGVE